MNFDNNIISKIADYVDNKSLINLSNTNKENYELLKNKREEMYERLWKENNLEDVNPKAIKYTTRKSILFKYIHKICRECYNKFGYKSFCNIYICKKCNELDKYKFIKQYEVQQYFKLPLKKIKELTITINRNSAILYNIKEIKDYIYNNYNKHYNEYITDINNKNNEKSLKKAINKQNLIKKRKIYIDNYIKNNLNNDKTKIENYYYNLYINNSKLNLKWIEEVIKRDKLIDNLKIELNLPKQIYDNDLDNYIIYNNYHYNYNNQTYNKFNNYEDLYNDLYRKEKDRQRQLKYKAEKKKRNQEKKAKRKQKEKQISPKMSQLIELLSYKKYRGKILHYIDNSDICYRYLNEDLSYEWIKEVFNRKKDIYYLVEKYNININYGYIYYNFTNYISNNQYSKDYEIDGIYGNIENFEKALKEKLNL